MQRDLWDRVSTHVGALMGLAEEDRHRRMAELRETDVLTADAVVRVFEQLEPGAGPTLGTAGLRGLTWGAAGKPVGPYTLEVELGRGGMGSVWRARRTDGRYDGLVAVKFLDMALSGVGGARRFEREGQILARLQHPNIARLIDAGVVDGVQSYLVLEFIDGRPIDEYCNARALGTRERLRLMLDVLAAVAHAHSRLILHRDLKPANVLVTPAGEVKLLDFGIAKLMDDAAGIAMATELTQMAGGPCTPAYAAPEQALGEDVSTQTDVYSLGLMLYLLLCGVHPTNPDGLTRTRAEEFKATLHTQPRRMSDAATDAGHLVLARELRGDLDNIVAKALKKLPGERYANASEFADDLRRHLNDEPVSARPDSAAYLAMKFLKRHRLGVAAVSALVLSLAGGVTASVWQAREARAQRVQAEGLVEFMLGDLRKKLQPVGRLDVMDAVGEKALAYYDAQVLTELDADSLGRRSRALHLIGEIRQLRGHLADAMKVFETAAATTAQLKAQHPGDGQRLFDHAQSLYWVGYVAWLRGHLDEARTAFNGYRDLGLQLVALDAANADWRLEPAYAASNLGVIEYDAGRPREALAALDEAGKVFEREAAQRPELLIEQANNNGWRAKALERLGQFGAAQAEQVAKIELLKRLPDFATNREAQRLLAVTNNDLSALELCCGSLDEAERRATQARSGLQALIALDASNLDWRGQQLSSHLLLFEVALARGQTAEAQASLRQASAVLDRLLGTDSPQARWRIGLRAQVLEAGLRLAAVTGAGESDSAPLDAFLAEAASADREAASAATGWQLPVAGVECQLAERLHRRHDDARARPLWQSAERRLAPLAAAGDMAARALLARAQWRQGRTAEAMSLTRALDAVSYRHPVFADLRKDIARETGGRAVTTGRK